MVGMKTMWGIKCMGVYLDMAGVKNPICSGSIKKYLSSSDRIYFNNLEEPIISHCLHQLYLLLTSTPPLHFSFTNSCSVLYLFVCLKFTKL